MAAARNFRYLGQMLLCVCLVQGKQELGARGVIGGLASARPAVLTLALVLWMFGSGQLQAGNDRFGVAIVAPTVDGGREWFASWNMGRRVGSYSADQGDAYFYNEEGELRISEGIGRLPAGMSRLVVLANTNHSTSSSGPLWTNVEMTVYARRGAAARTLDYQAFYLSARSGERHNDSVPCDGTSYHATARFDGQCGFKKELWHTGGYTALRPDPTPKPWPTVPEGKWIGMKFLCRNCDHGSHVRLELYLDVEERNEWKKVSEFTDQGGWRGEKAGCNRPQDAIITEGRPAVYFRTDYVAVELKKFSVREVEPLP
jgi:hypothetical protein